MLGFQLENERNLENLDNSLDLPILFWFITLGTYTHELERLPRDSMNMHSPDFHIEQKARSGANKY